MSARFSAGSGNAAGAHPMYQFLFLGHTSLNYVYSEQHQRQLLAEAERKWQLASVPARSLTWASVFSVVKADLQALLLIRTRVKDAEVSTSSQSHADKPQFRRPGQPATIGRDGVV
jgi:hypothetical protein